MIESITHCFESFEDDVFQSMVIVDHHRWDYENANYRINEINSLANHFSKSLKFHDFNLQAALFEFRQLKKLGHGKYSHMQQPTLLWNVIFQ